jgi:hypothetical protein
VSNVKTEQKKNIRLFAIGRLTGYIHIKRRYGENMGILDECVSYFRENTGFARFMDGLLDMYVRYERCFGAVRLSEPNMDEERAVSEFFKRDYYNQALIRIGLADFERQLQKTFSPEMIFWRNTWGFKKSKPPKLCKRVHLLLRFCRSFFLNLKEPRRQAG